MKMSKSFSLEPVGTGTRYLDPFRWALDIDTVEWKSPTWGKIVRRERRILEFDRSVDIEEAKERVEREFGVPISAWRADGSASKEADSE